MRARSKRKSEDTDAHTRVPTISASQRAAIAAQLRKRPRTSPATEPVPVASGAGAASTANHKDGTVATTRASGPDVLQLLPWDAARMRAWASCPPCGAAVLVPPRFPTFIPFKVPLAPVYVVGGCGRFSVCAYRGRKPVAWAYHGRGLQVWRQGWQSGEGWWQASQTGSLDT